MDLGEVLKTYLSDDQNGQLVIKFVGENHLCKISIENGQAVYLTLGTMGPNDTLDEIFGKVAEWTNFLKGMPARKRLDEPVPQRLLNIAGAAPLPEGEVLLAVTAAADNSSKNEVINGDALVDATQVSAAINRFTDLVGPLASILTATIFSNLAHTDGAPMSATTYNRFITALAAEVPDDDRQGFIDAAAQ